MDLSLNSVFMSLTLAQYSQSEKPAKVPLFGALDPYGLAVPKLLYGLGKDKEYVPKMNPYGVFTIVLLFRKMKVDLAFVKQWDFRRLIMAHGVSDSLLIKI